MADTQTEIAIQVRGLSVKDFQNMMKLMNKINYEKYIPKSTRRKNIIFILSPYVLAVALFVFLGTCSNMKADLVAAIALSLFAGAYIGIFVAIKVVNNATKALFKFNYSFSSVFSKGYQLIFDPEKLQLKTDNSYSINYYHDIQERFKLNDKIWIIRFTNQHFIWIYINELGNAEITQQIKQQLQIA